MSGMEVAGIQAARWVLGKALDVVSSGALEAWAASTELGTNMEALKMELLYAQGMLNNARGREIQNLALVELLQKLRDLGYRADDVLDELDYFRIQDELDGTFHAADEHEGGCLRNCAFNAVHTAKAISKKLTGISKCCSHGDSHKEPAGGGIRGGGRRCGAWPCLGLATPSDEEEEEEEEEIDDHGCMGRLATGARNTIHSVGKHLPCHSACCVQNDSNSNVASNKRQRFLCCAWPSKTPKLKFNRVKVSQNMKEIVEQLKPVCAKVSTILNLELLDSNRSMAQWIAMSLDGRLSNKQYHAPIQQTAKSRPITTSEFIEPKLYGREDKTSNIIHNITKGEYSDKALTVLPIVGPGGIGKTTLTQYIYNDVELQKHFAVKLWVCVSVNFNVYRLTQEIADKLPREGTRDKKESPDKLVEERLKSKKVLLVLDDMWNCSDEDEWKRFLLPFTKGKTKGSVILVTTRFPAVANMVKTVDHVDLKGLDHEAFKQLFLACAFGDRKAQNDHGLLQTGDMIMEKLKGSPLAAKTVGRLLRNNLDLDHWTKVLESREWESQQGDHDIMPALKLSFDYLPFHLQQCFTYCALFPQDYRFSREELIHFWIGLDALHSHSENISSEDIGVCYLNELVSHGFFKMEEEYGGTCCYVIHDLLHELALKVSANECLSIYYSSSVNSSTQIFPSIRHLSINIDDSSVKDRMTLDDCTKEFSALDKRLKVENLYSLMLFGKHQASFGKIFCHLFSKAKSLRVIFLSEGNYGMEDLLPNYFNLIHLRYLRTNGGLGSGLSKNISRYYHLRVLHLHESNHPFDLTRDISNLRNLRHFIVYKGDHIMHSRIPKVGRLKSLQTLKRFAVKNEMHDFELRQIGQLSELRGVLLIDNLEMIGSREEAEEAKLVHKKHLREVFLFWDIDRSNKDPAREEQVLEGLKPNSNIITLAIRSHQGAKCSSWLGVNLSIKNLENLSLDNVAWRTFPPIGKLWLVNEELPCNVPNQNFHNLRWIELLNLQGVKKWAVDSTCQFYSCLEILTIGGCNELSELSFSNYTCGQQAKNSWFPKLRRLQIVDCPRLSSLPPVPWTRAFCEIHLQDVGLNISLLRYDKSDDSALSLRIEGKHFWYDSDKFWMSLDFHNLTELKRLKMTRCPPPSLDHLKMLSSLKYLEVRCLDSDVFWRGKQGKRVQFQLPIESFRIEHLYETSGRELTQVLSCMPKLLKLSMAHSWKVTELGVVAQEKATISPLSWVTRVGALAGQLLPWSSGGLEAEATRFGLEDGLLLLPPQLQELDIANCLHLSLHPDSVGLQGLCSLRYLKIWDCPKFFSLYLAATSSASCYPFPTSLQELYLFGDQYLQDSQPQPAAEEVKTVSFSNISSLTELMIAGYGGDMRGVGRHLPLGCLNRLRVSRTHDFFFLVVDPRAFSVLQSLETDDIAGLLAAPVCSLLSSSLTELVLLGDDEIECFTEQQETALQLLTSIQKLEFSGWKKLRCLPAAGLRGLPNLKRLMIYHCEAIRSLPKKGFPNSLEELTIFSCSAIRSLHKDGLPTSLRKIKFENCPAIHSLPKDGLPNSLQELVIMDCPTIRTLPKDGLPSSLRLLHVKYCRNKELKSHCRKLIGTIPIVIVDD